MEGAGKPLDLSPGERYSKGFESKIVKIWSILILDSRAFGGSILTTTYCQYAILKRLPDRKLQH